VPGLCHARVSLCARRVMAAALKLREDPRLYADDCLTSQKISAKRKEATEKA
jgi:hypothetical protein